MAAPDIKLHAKRKFENADGSSYWAPIGDIHLWRDEKKGTYSGQLRVFLSGQTFKLFPADGEPPAKPKQKLKADTTTGLDTPFG
jgi:hypothetical protein